MKRLTSERLAEIREQWLNKPEVRLVVAELIEEIGWLKVELRGEQQRVHALTAILADTLPPDKLAAFAKTGLDALIDEATGHQQARPKDALRKGHEKYTKPHTDEASQ